MDGHRKDDPYLEGDRCYLGASWEALGVAENPLPSWILDCLSSLRVSASSRKALTSRLEVELKLMSNQFFQCEKFGIFRSQFETFSKSRVSACGKS